MNIYDINGKIIINVDVDDSSYRHRVINGEHNLNLKYALTEHVELPVGAYCIFQGEKYTLERPENLKMKHSHNFEYTVTMESYQAKAKIWKFRNTVDGRLKFSLTAKPVEHLQMFVDNMNRRDKGWTVGECVDGIEQLINYDHDFCWDALTKQASEFKTEFEIVGKRVSLKKVEYNKNNPLPLSYGCGKGFKPGLGRSNSSNTPPVEILYVQGGSDNIDRSKYGNGELLLPKGQTISYDGEHFEDEQGFNPNNSRKYVVDDMGLSLRRADKPISTLSEDSLDCSNIYPKRIGIVSNVIAVNVSKNFYDIEDNSIPEALNYEECLIAGETMTIIFQSGMLAGREFEVKYYHTSIKGKAARRFEIIPQEIDGVTMPSSTFIPKNGDRYAVFKCMLPNAYICDNSTKSGAEWDMFRTAIKHKFDNEEQKFTFTGELDGIWAKKDWENIGGRIILGGYILFRDEHFQKEGVLVRITGIKDYINNPHSPMIEISNNTVSGGFSSDIKKLQSEEVLIEEYHKDALQFTKRRFRDAKETIAMLEESLLDNYSNSINPIAVQTMSLLIGDESLQFRFVDYPDSTYSKNHVFTYDSERKVFSTDGGIIQHLTLGIKSLSSQRNASDYKVWNISKYTSARLDDANKRYYLYIKADASGSGTGEFYLSENAIKMLSVSGYYHFLVGVLNSEYNDDRSFVPLYGYSEILPGRITTDRIISGDGRSYFDMVANAMKLGSVLDFNSQGDGKLRLRGTLVQNEGGSESYIGCYRGEYNPAYTYYNGDEVSFTYEGATSTYRYINKEPSKGNQPTNTKYWQVIANGADGKYTELIFAKNGSTTEPPFLRYGYYEPEGWYPSIPEVEKGEYLWMSSGVKSGDGETLIRDWSTPVRITPYDAKDNTNDGHPVLVYRGTYDSTKTYYGNKYRLDCVKTSNGYYIARIDAGEFRLPPPPHPAKWNSFGASFESVATNLLLAEGANIGDWFISEGKIVSTLEDDNKIILDAKERKIKILSNNTNSMYQSERLANVIIDIDASKGQIEARSNNNVAYISPTGVFANRAGTGCVPVSSGLDYRASVVGLGFSDLSLDQRDLIIQDMNPQEEVKLVAGVYGDTYNTGSAPSYGGYFNYLKINGLILGQTIIDKSGFYLKETHSLAISIGSKNSVYLPATKRVGLTIFIKQLMTGSLTIYPRSGQKMYDDHTPNDYFEIGEATMLMATFTIIFINGKKTEVWVLNAFKY